MTPLGQLTDVPGLRVGHAHDLQALTGVTVVLPDDPAGAVFAALPTGPATSTRQIDGGRGDHLVSRAHAILLSGGSAFGLGAADGVMAYLAERGIGHNVRGLVVPTVPTAVLFDLGIGDGARRPDAAMARTACVAAGRETPRGSVGAGCGATIGKGLGPALLMKGGIGTASRRHGDVVVGALAAVNAFGDVVDPDTGRVLAGARDPDDPMRLADLAHRLGRDLATVVPSPIENTTLALIAVNAALDKGALARVARMAAAGMARAIVPAHCVFDGDIVFALATGGDAGNENLIGHMAAAALADAITDAARSADGLGRVPDRRTLKLSD